MRSHRASLRFALLVAPVLLAAASPAGSTVLTGSITDLLESGAPFYWGDGVNDLYQVWSLRQPDSSGWFYGTGYYPRFSNADVYIYRGLTDPTQVTNAETFPYTNTSDWGAEGDCVFFHGANGFFGAWRIDAITPVEGGPPYAELDGRWYFQDDGTGDFSGPTPVAATSWGAIKQLYR